MKERNPIINTQLNRLAELLSKFLDGIYFYWLLRYIPQFISIAKFISSYIWHFAYFCLLLHSRGRNIRIEFKPDKYSNFNRKYDCFQLCHFSLLVMRAELWSFCKFNQTVLFCRSRRTPLYILNHVCTEHTLKFRRFMSSISTTANATSLNYSKYSQPLESTNSCVSLSSKRLKDGGGAQKVRDMSSQSVSW